MLYIIFMLHYIFLTQVIQQIAASCDFDKQFDLCLFRVFWKLINGESCLQEDSWKKDKVCFILPSSLIFPWA